MNVMSGSLGSPLAEAVDALGEILASQGESVAVVVVGGTAMIVQGFVERATSDVDVIAIARDINAGRQGTIEPPEPLPESLVQAISRVARDFNLPDDWMNHDCRPPVENGSAAWIRRSYSLASTRWPVAWSCGPPRSDPDEALRCGR